MCTHNKKISSHIVPHSRQKARMRERENRHFHHHPNQHIKFYMSYTFSILMLWDILRTISKANNFTSYYSDVSDNPNMYTAVYSEGANLYINETLMLNYYTHLWYKTGL